MSGSELTPVDSGVPGVRYGDANIAARFARMGITTAVLAVLVHYARQIAPTFTEILGSRASLSVKSQARSLSAGTENIAYPDLSSANPQEMELAGSWANAVIGYSIDVAGGIVIYAIAKSLLALSKYVRTLPSEPLRLNSPGTIDSTDHTEASARPRFFAFLPRGMTAKSGPAL